MAQDLDNFNVALRSARTLTPELAARLVLAVDPLLATRGPSRLHFEWLEIGLAAARLAESRALEARLLRARGSSLAAIRALPFVAEVRPVARGRGRQTLADAPPSSSAAVPAGTVASADALHGGDVAEAGPSYPQLARIGIPEAHALGYHGEGIVIGVLDTGFALEHEAFHRLHIVAVRDYVQGDDTAQ
jgi:hypothetical protein